MKKLLELAKEKTYSSRLGIDLGKGRESEVFKWFLASLLFGKPIQEGVAINTIRLFLSKRIDTPKRILKAGWNNLVKILDEGGYVRYDFSTATKLLGIMKKLNDEYGGKVTNIYKKSGSQAELEKRLTEFKGIGPMTVNIFLRELRTVWKVDPEPSKLVKQGAKKLGIDLSKFNRRTKQFIRIECALLRIGKGK